MARNSVSSFSLIALLLLSGCNASDVQNWVNQNIKPLLSPTKKQAPAKTDDESPEPPPLENRKINGEFLREMFQVVLGRDMAGEEEFGRLMNVLDQGGHYEGVYNGVVYSTEYREKEKGNATVAALKTFAEVMAQLALDQKYDSLKIKAPEDSDLPISNPQIAPPQPTPEERSQLIGLFEREGLTKSQYTLKRRLGEELLKTIELKKEYREKLATWYGKFTVFMNGKGVDYGIQQRNVKDEYYHYKWALDADEDRLKWECLNRAHRLMNSKI